MDFVRNPFVRNTDFQQGVTLAAGFRHESLLSSFDENRIFHSRFRDVQSNYEATDNVLILF